MSCRRYSPYIHRRRLVVDIQPTNGVLIDEAQAMRLHSSLGIRVHMGNLFSTIPRGFVQKGCWPQNETTYCHAPPALNTARNVRFRSNILPRHPLTVG